MPGPVEGKGEVNSPEMQVGTVLISARHVSGGYGGFKGLRPAAEPELEFGLNGLHIESCLACLALMV